MFTRSTKVFCCVSQEFAEVAYSECGSHGVHEGRLEVHALDRATLRCLDYHGFRFPTKDSLYLGMLLECLGFSTKTNQIAKHKKMLVSVAMAMDCCVRAPLTLMIQWHTVHLTTLCDIICHCCLTHPDYLMSLRANAKMDIY